MKRVYAGHLSPGAPPEGELSQAIVTRLQGL